MFFISILLLFSFSLRFAFAIPHIMSAIFTVLLYVITFIWIVAFEALEDFYCFGLVLFGFIAPVLSSSVGIAMGFGCCSGLCRISELVILFRALLVFVRYLWHGGFYEMRNSSNAGYLFLI